MKIYTKTGDRGQTALIGGARVSKHHPRLEAYGTVDELNAHIGMVHDTCNDDTIKAELRAIQNNLFVLGSLLALEPDEKKHTYKMPKLPCMEEEDIQRLENWIDEHSKALPPLNGFILPGGHVVISHCHIARTVCRRAERNVIMLSTETKIDKIVIIYLNRLSDYLFTLARYFSMNNQVEELIWQPKR